MRVEQAGHVHCLNFQHIYWHCTPGPEDSAIPESFRKRQGSTRGSSRRHRCSMTAPAGAQAETRGPSCAYSGAQTDAGGVSCAPSGVQAEAGGFSSNPSGAEAGVGGFSRPPPGAQAEPRGVCSAPPVTNPVWSLTPAPMAVCGMRLLASAAIIPVVIMSHDEYRYDGSAVHRTVHTARSLCPASVQQALKWRAYSHCVCPCTAVQCKARCILQRYLSLPLPLLLSALGYLSLSSRWWLA